MNGCIYRTQSDLCKLYTKADTISFCRGEDCPDRKQSNADRIRSMTDEELADFLDSIVQDWHQGTAQIVDRIIDSWLDWLKEEAEGDT